MSEKVKGAVFFIIIILVVAAAAFITMYEQPSREDEIIVGVHVKGAVNAPGYYELSYGSRLKDAVEFAGGETADADLEKVNLALKLRDGEEIVIPVSEKEQKDNSDKININKADSYTLCKLDGIGSKLAADIIAYRAENGNFSSIQQLKKVDGIGEAKFEKIKDRITV